LKAQKTSCLNNLRQLAVASTLYVTDYQKFFIYNNGGSSLWMGTLVDYYSKVNSLRVCPAATTNSPNFGPSGANKNGYADTAWNWYGLGTNWVGSYQVNGWLYNFPDLINNPPTFKSSGFPPGVSTMVPLLFQKETDIFNPSLTPMFADSSWVDGWPGEQDHPASSFYDPYNNLTGGEAGMGRMTLQRHFGKSASSAMHAPPAGMKLSNIGGICVGFYDGHSEAEKLDALWTLNWHKNWNAGALLNPLTVP